MVPPSDFSPAAVLEWISLGRLVPSVTATPVVGGVITPVSPIRLYKTVSSTLLEW